MTVENMKKMFIIEYEEENSVFCGCREFKEETLALEYKGESLESCDIYVSFLSNDDGTSIATVFCYDLPNFSTCFEAGLRACNQLNDQEFVKYYIDDDGDAVASAVLTFEMHGIKNLFSPQQILAIATTMALSVDIAYGVFEKEKWTR